MEPGGILFNTLLYRILYCHFIFLNNPSNHLTVFFPPLSNPGKAALLATLQTGVIGLSAFTFFK
jgi:hypothetical protein